MQKMQFGSFVFPHNPAQIEISHTQPTQTISLPHYGSHTRRFGGENRTIVCSGAFVGASPDIPRQHWSAWEQAARNGRGLLFLPGESPFYALATQWKLHCSGSGCVLPYSILWVEEGER